MSEAKHTPGPWWAATQNDGLYVISGERPAHNHDYPKHNARREVVAQAISGARRDANARLIAAAPELLEALREASTDLMIAANNAANAAKTDSRWEGVAERLRERRAQCDAAIRKATEG